MIISSTLDTEEEAANPDIKSQQTATTTYRAGQDGALSGINGSATINAPSSWS
jgi:hypothetical protein